MARRDATNLTKVLRAVEQNGLLMQADSELPSVVTLLVGEPVHGSWWGHPMGDAIHIVNTHLKEHRDIIAAHLVSRKVTFIHRRAWPALFGVALSGEPWQSQNLGPLARRILGLVTRKQSVRSDDESIFGELNSAERRAGIRELERRLLVHSTDTHTETGTHTKTLQTWERCRERKRFRGHALAAEKARAQLDRLVDAWRVGSDVRATLPWAEK